MDREGLSVKEILIGNKITKIQEKLLDIINHEQDQLIKQKVSDDERPAILMCLTAAFNTYTTVLAASIHNGYFDKKEITKELSKDFFKEIDRKLEGYKKEDLENS